MVYHPTRRGVMERSVIPYAPTWVVRKPILRPWSFVLGPSSFVRRQPYGTFLATCGYERKGIAMSEANPVPSQRRSGGSRRTARRSKGIRRLYSGGLTITREEGVTQTMPKVL